MNTTATATNTPLEAKPGLPPGPRMTRLLQSLAFLTRQPAFMRRARKKYGPMFTVKIAGFPNFVILGDPELIKKTYTAPVDVLHAGTDSPLAAVLGKHSLLAIDEDVHLSQRRLLLPAFHGERMRGYADVFGEIASNEFDNWRPGEEFPVLPSMQRITLLAILRTIFGAHDQSLRTLIDLIPATVDQGQRWVLIQAAQHDLGPLSPWGKFLRLRAQCDAELDKLIAEARADENIEDRDDVLAMLVQATYEDGSPMGDAEIRDQLMTLMIAGHETTATTLAWMVERLRRNPRVLAKLTESVRAGETDYLDAAVNETLRVRPTVNFAVRLVMKPFELGGYVLPVGTRIATNPILTHENPELFGEPIDYQPERFLDGRPSSYAYIPFGGGVRRCIGAAFAQMEAQVVMKELLERFDLETTDAPSEGWGFRGVTFVPKNGGLARVQIHERSAAPAESTELAGAAA
jgi:cytochrome P450